MNTDNYANSITMDLENLQQIYSNVLIQYKQAVTDYINYLNTEAQQPCNKYKSDSKNVDQKCYEYIWKKAGCSTTGIVNASTDWAKSQTLNGLIYDSFLWSTLTDDTHRQGCYGSSTNYSNQTQPNYNIEDKTFVTVKEAAYVGTGNAEQTTATTLEECQTACADSSTCSGATFVAGKCNLRIGNSPIIPSSSDSYAIVPKGKQLLMNMEDLNQQLLNINREITKKMNIGNPVYNEFKTRNDEKSRELIQTYKELESERENIRQLLEEYKTLDTTENENQIKITQNYYTYILLSILAIAIIFLLVKISIPDKQTTAPMIQYGGELNQNAYYIIFAIILIATGVNFWVKYFSL